MSAREAFWAAVVVIVVVVGLLVLHAHGAF
jgi:hypothetical protein